MNLSHRIALDPTAAQCVALAKACGVARFAWNWALAEWNRQYEAGGKPTAYKLKAEWNRIKGELYPWVYESPKDANQQPFANLDKAFKRFFKKTAKHPKFKKKGWRDSFYLSNDRLQVDGKRVRLPVIGWVRMREELRFAGKITSATVSRTADRWFVSIQVEGDFSRKRKSDGQVGVDVGVKSALATSTGQVFEAPKPLKAGLKRLKTLAQRVSRKVKGSSNHRKAVVRLGRFQARIANIRRDWTHKVTTQICRENQAIALEDLNVRGMLANHRLARAISDIGFSEIQRQIEYKAKLYDNHVLIVDRWAPTSKTCSRCGEVKAVLPLQQRVFSCDRCGFEADRDLNAATNILTLGLRGCACGPEVGGHRLKTVTEPIWDEAGTKMRVTS